MLKSITHRRRLLRKNMYKAIAPKKRRQREKNNFNNVKIKKHIKVKPKVKTKKKSKGATKGYKMAYRYRYYKINENNYEDMNKSKEDDSS